jgi:hypothetical protein
MITSFSMVVLGFVRVRGWMFVARVIGLRVTESNAFPFLEITNSMEQNS